MFSLSKINNPRLLLAQVREGDFAHAGDREAIDIGKKIIEKKKKSKGDSLQNNFLLYYARPCTFTVGPW